MKKILAFKKLNLRVIIELSMFVTEVAWVTQKTGGGSLWHLAKDAKGLVCRVLQAHTPIQCTHSKAGEDGRRGRPPFP